MNAINLVVLLATAFFGLAASAADGTDAMHVRDDSGQGYVACPLQGSGHQSKMNKSEENGGYGYPTYTMNLAIGSDHQNISMALFFQWNETILVPPCVYDPEGFNFDSCNGTDRYRTSSSTTFKNLSHIRDPMFGDASSFTDDIQFGSRQLRAQAMKILPDGNFPFAGFLGLANTVSPSNMSFRESLLAQGLVHNTAFSIDMRHQADNKFTEPGSVVFGGIDQNKYACGNWKQLQIAQGRSLDLRLQKVSAALRPNATKEWDLSILTQEESENGIYAQLVPGTMWYGGLAVPLSLYHAIFGEWPNATAAKPFEFASESLYTVPCNAPAGSLNFTFEGHSDTIQIPLQDLVGDEVSGLGVEFGRQCVSKIVPSAATWFAGTLIGDPFFLSSYVVYDLQPGSILFASKADCGSNITAFGKADDHTSNNASLNGGCGCSGNTTSPANPTSTTALPKNGAGMTISAPWMATVLFVSMLSIAAAMAL
ncbi:aspartic peptidase domain-containing protein [Lophiotrema nucula]|uniref:Aspartic peptidase domain-containing protein n=1 Tax=Lophiotrema nucula TaxID=690887 RepID=A0A6A5ZNP2_9PLEO|nr:aspartic peptidase domain-containing protein [Lophiotrema nucula]